MSNKYKRWLIAVAPTLLLLCSCNRGGQEVSAALAEFQEAQLAGNLDQQERALLKLVAVEEGNRDAWALLGQVQMQQGKLGAAFSSTSRALEFDRDDPDLLRTLAELSVRSDNVDVASQFVQKLDVVAPGDPMSVLVSGIIALRRGDYETADRLAEDLLAGPAPSDGRILKSQVLLRTGEEELAVKVLEDQLRALPDDTFTMHALALLHEREERWDEVAKYRLAIWKRDNKNFRKAVDYTRAALAAGQEEEALKVARGVMEKAPGWLLDPMLEVWEKNWDSPRAIRVAHELGRQSAGFQRLSYARYLNRVGAPKQAMSLIFEMDDTRDLSFNLRVRAVIAESLVALGRLDEAQRIIGDVLKKEPENVDALRARARLRTERGQIDQAIFDGRRIVALEPMSARNRHVLADIFIAANEERAAERTLWDAFQKIKTDRSIYQRLRKRLLERGQNVERLDRQYRDQVDHRLARNLLT